MKEFQGRRRWYSPVVIVILLGLGVLLGRAVWRLYGAERVATARLERLVADWKKLAKREEFLTVKLAALSTARGIEEVIREKFAVVRSGEKVVNIVGDEPTTTPLATDETWWQKVVSFFQSKTEERD
ncbi:MAG: hypothetical protein AAB468_03100 [Patescibacteria group bacterium]